MFLVNPCFVNPCKNNATCQISGVTYICTCQAFYSGTNCQTCTLERKWSYFESLEFNFYYYTAVTNSCLSTPCLNGGQCTPTGTGSTYTCNCSGGYSGLNCQTCNISLIKLRLIVIDQFYGYKLIR